MVGSWSCRGLWRLSTAFPSTCAVPCPLGTHTIQPSERPVLWFPERSRSQALQERVQSEDRNQGSGARSQYLSPLHVLQARAPVIVKVSSEEPRLHLPGSACSFISCSSYWGFRKILSEERLLFSFQSFENHCRESHKLGSTLLPPM